MTQESFLAALLPIQDRLYRLAYNMLQDREEARDVVQDVLVKLWKKKDELAEYRSIEALSLKVTKNTVLDRIKYQKRRQAPVRSLHDQKDPGEISSAKDSVAVVRKIIEQLPEKQRILIQLRDMEELDYATIAEVMDISIGEVKIGLFRARQTLREKINKLNAYGISGS